MTTRNSNKLPAPGDAVLRYHYRNHTHEEVPSGVVMMGCGKAVGGGYFVQLKDETVVAVENFDAKRKEWIEKRPRFEGSPNLQRDAEHKG